MDELKKKYQKAFDLAQPYLYFDGKDPEPPDEEKLNEAMSICIELIGIPHISWAIYWLKGKIHQTCEQAEESYKCFKQAFEKAKDEDPVQLHACVIRELAWSCLIVEKIEEARYYTKLAIEFEDDPGLLSNHALALIVLQEYDQAKEYLSRAIDQAKGRGDTWVETTGQCLVTIISKIESGTIAPPTTYAGLIDLAIEKLG